VKPKVNFRLSQQSSLIFFGGRRYGRGSWHPNGHWEFLFEFLNLHVWNRNDWPLMCFFSLLNIEDGDVLQEINFKYLCESLKLHLGFTGD
jgi:hypothetical protein